LGPAQADSPEWQATIENVVKSVVSIHFCQTCSFDTDLSMASQATGFVVDAEKGYILTNRHVVCAGPFWGYCIFDNHEEVGFFFVSFFSIIVHIRFLDSILMCPLLV
jgi:S1-C subfamily serine protease